jgi:hypothetical protein
MKYMSYVHVDENDFEVVGVDDYGILSYGSVGRAKLC